MRRSQREKVWNRDKATCTYCTKIITEKEDLTIDHVFPKKLGGTNRLSNLTTCCKSCNLDKGMLLLTQYLRAFEIEITPEIARFL